MSDMVMDAHHLVGAAPINGEIEVGFDQRFERRWHYYEIAGRVVMIIVVAAGLFGFLGSGPFSHQRVDFPYGRLAAIDFEPITRFDTTTQVTFHLRPDAGEQAAGIVRVRLSSNTIEPFGLQHTHPASEQQEAANGDVIMTVPVDARGKDDLIRIIGRPTQFGPIHMTVQIDGGPAHHWTQFALP